MYIDDQSYFRRIIPLPKLTENQMRVTVFQAKDANPEKFDLNNYLGYTFNIAFIRILEDIVNKDIYVYDFEHLKSGHVTKMSPVGIKKAGIIMEVRISFLFFISNVIIRYTINVKCFTFNILGVKRTLNKWLEVASVIIN